MLSVQPFSAVLSFFVLAVPGLFSCGDATHTSTLSAQAENEAPQLIEGEILPLDTFAYTLPWLSNYSVENKIVNRISVPKGYTRMDYNQGTFQHWLRHLPLKEGNPQVYLYNGQLKGNQSAHAYVMDIDIGDKDLQQCADAAMRLRAEYLFSNHQKEAIRFNYTNGANVPYSKWRQGFMPVPEGKTVKWVASAKAGEGYEKFKAYMIQIFNYAGTLSLSKELTPIALEDIQPGDLFIKGGSPGHAVMIMDMAIHPETGNKVFLLSQSYMPAQNIQILKNPSNSLLSPWYSLAEIGAHLYTPEWTFDRHQVMRW
jgi:hypothetical protein